MSLNTRLISSYRIRVYNLLYEPLSAAGGIRTHDIRIKSSVRQPLRHCRISRYRFYPSLFREEQDNQLSPVFYFQYVVNNRTLLLVHLLDCIYKIKSGYICTPSPCYLSIHQISTSWRTHLTKSISTQSIDASIVTGIIVITHSV